MEISEARFYLAAAGLHVMVGLAAFVVPVKLPPQLEGPPIEVSIEVELPESKPVAVVAPATTAESPRAEDTPQVARTDRSAVTNPTAVEPSPSPSGVEPPSTGSPVATAGPAKTSEYDGPAAAVQTGPVGVLTGLGPAWAIPGTLPDIGRAPPAPTTSPATTVDPKVATRILKEVLKEKDKALGLDSPAAGTVSSAVRSAIQATNTPPESKATFEIRLSATGQVLSAKVTSSSGGSSEDWARAAAAVAASLKGQTLAMRGDYSKGAVVYVSAQSLLTLPDGSKSAIEQKGAGAQFDLSNIGAHKQRVVRTSYSVVAVK